MHRHAISRRNLLGGLTCLPAGWLAGCKPSNRVPPEGSLVGPSWRVGHAVRDGISALQPQRQVRVDAVVVGGGVSGLSAGWTLQREGIEDFVVLELESHPGGTSCYDQSGLVAYPWGAHYLPVPLQENRDLLSLLDEMGVIAGYGPGGEPIAREEYLCRDPQERIFQQGVWQEGLYPGRGATAEDLRQLAEFQRQVDTWVSWRDGDNKRAFAIPLANSSRDEIVRRLDAESMADWMDRHKLVSPRLRWLVDYSCRDDYGLRLDQTSAWAGLFYFASRTAVAAGDSQPLLTWPEGNGRIVSHLAQQVGPRVRLGRPAISIEPAGTSESRMYRTLTVSSEDPTDVTEFISQAVIFAAPHYLAPHMLPGYAADRPAVAKQFRYASWLVANLFLNSRPPEPDFPLAWDNVIYDSPGLGYVVATHQRGLDFGPTVWTYYMPLCHEDADQARRELLGLDWAACCELVLRDLETAHPDIRSRVDRLDVMRWAHAMIQPRPGFIWGSARQQALKAWRGIEFANTDLSGVALCEEAFFHGRRAARSVAARLRTG